VAPDIGHSVGRSSIVDASGDATVVQVAATPHSIVMSHDGAHAYVTHFRSGMVSVLNTTTNVVEKSLQTNPGLYGAALSENGKFLHVVHPDSEFVDTIEISTGQSVSDGVGVKAYGLSMGSGGKLYAARALDDSIEVFGVVSISALFEAGLLDSLVRSIARLNRVDFPVALAASPDGSRLYVSNYFSGTVEVIDTTEVKVGDFTSNATVVATIPVSPNPYGITVAPDASRVFVAHFQRDNIVSVIDTASHSVTTIMDVRNGPVRGVAVTPDGARLYVTNYFESSVSIITL
jgi:YVTN family beta-propeller protein